MPTPCRICWLHRRPRGGSKELTFLSSGKNLPLMFWHFRDTRLDVLTVLHVHPLLVVVLVEISGQNVALVGCDVTGGDVECESYVI